MRVREITEVFGLSKFGQKTQRQKDAAAWKAQVKARSATVPPVTALLTHGTIRTASDGQTYKLDIGRGGDMIWFNVTTGAEAEPAIDAELMK
jgi:hemin uptake protein HemP